MYKDSGTLERVTMCKPNRGNLPLLQIARQVQCGMDPDARNVEQALAAMQAIGVLHL